jgi:hypothetical protein
MEWAIIAALCIFPLLGFTFLCMGLRNVWQAHASNSWPVADGLVVESSVTTKGSSYLPKVVASYTASGKPFTTETVHFGQTAGSSDSTEADLLLLRYPQGAKVRVSYDPNDPARSVIVPGFDSELLWLPGAGLAFGLPGIMFLLLFLGGDRSSSGLKVALTLFSTIFCLIGLAMLIPGLLRLWNGHSSTSWPTAQGTLLKKSETSDTAVERDTTGVTRRSTTYSTGLVYEFSVNGKMHYAATRRFGQLAGADQEWAAEIASRYESGAPVTVHYYPSNPDLAVLEPGTSSEALYLPGAGLAFLLFGLAVFVFAIPALS